VKSSEITYGSAAGRRVELLVDRNPPIGVGARPTIEAAEATIAHPPVIASAKSGWRSLRDRLVESNGVYVPSRESIDNRVRSTRGRRAMTAAASVATVRSSPGGGIR